MSALTDIQRWNNEHSKPAAPAPSDVAQLVAMFAQLGDYGQRVTLAQMAAMLRVQNGGK